MKHGIISRASLIACVAAIVIGIYKSEYAYDYMIRQEWLPRETPAWQLPNSQLFSFIDNITNSSRTSATELSLALTRMGANIDTSQFQNWVSGAFYSRFSFANDSSRIGVTMAKKGLKAKHPVIIIPGFVTSGLELWEGRECFKGHFRARMWTQYNMARLFLSNRECWMEHLSLDFITGLDPKGIRVRNAQGLDAVDFFFPGYDVWAKVITSLADIGYDTNSMVALPYDWRLSVENLELRDAYYSRLRSQIELLHGIYGEGVLMVAHSWGDNVARSFMTWMEDVQPGWVDKHIAVHFNVAGPTLGVPKALTALLSGELRETANLLGVASVIGEQLLSKEERTLVWRTWGSSIGMLPAGGTRIWGNTTWAPDDSQVQGSISTASGSLGAFLSVVEDKGTGEVQMTVPLNVEQAAGVLIKDAGPVFAHHVEHWSDAAVSPDMPEQLNELFGKDDPEQVEKASAIHSNRPRVQAPVPRTTALNTPLPDAPRMRLYCGYGHGLPTERAYHYKHDSSGLEPQQCPAGKLEANPRVGLGQISAGKLWNLDCTVDATKGDSLMNGVVLGNGDGTVPLISLGYMCASAWQSKELNPSGMKVVVREYADDSASAMPRGGPGASSHVEVLRNPHFLEDLLHVAAGWYDEVDEQKIDSAILQVAALVDANGMDEG